MTTKGGGAVAVEGGLALAVRLDKSSTCYWNKFAETLN